jgi:membrane-bound ClpP family serine protease
MILLYTILYYCGILALIVGLILSGALAKILLVLAVLLMFIGIHKNPKPYSKVDLLIALAVVLIVFIKSIKEGQLISGAIYCTGLSLMALSFYWRRARA